MEEDDKDLSVTMQGLVAQDKYLEARMRCGTASKAFGEAGLVNLKTGGGRDAFLITLGEYELALQDLADSALTLKTLLGPIVLCNMQQQGPYDA